MYDLLNFEYRILFAVFYRQAQWKNQNKHSKFDTPKSLSCRVQFVNKHDGADFCYLLYLWIHSILLPVPIY